MGWVRGAGIADLLIMLCHHIDIYFTDIAF